MVSETSFPKSWIHHSHSTAILMFTQYGRNCLQLAVVHGHCDTVSKILQTGLVDIDAVNKV